MIQQALWRSSLLVVALGASILTSCRPDSDVTPQQVTTPTTATAATGTDKNGVPIRDVNSWILDNMRFWYYWNDRIPANPNQTLAPVDFFESLLYEPDNTANPNRDRFSWIQESAQELQASLSGESKTTGMEFRLYLRTTGSSDVVGSVLYVLPGSPAAKAGIKRGDVFYAVNGQKLTRDNYGGLLYGDAATLTFGFAKVQNGELVDTDQTKAVTPVVFQEDPVFLDSVYTVKGRTIGYLVYNQFVPGPNGSTVAAYDQRLDNIFAKFKQRGVNELVLDFRYNPGGYVSSATKLASLIAPGVTDKTVFARKEWSKTAEPELRKQFGDEFFNDYFQVRANNIGGTVKRVYVLTTGSTASASELVINGLRPFMTVTTVGTTSYGKNVGSITITGEQATVRVDKRIKWGMQPIVSKSFNSKGESDYGSGFRPAVEVREPLALLPLGDLNEPLLNTAVALITGDRTARRGIIPTLPVIQSSVERKAGGSNMFERIPGALPGAKQQ